MIAFAPTLVPPAPSNNNQQVVVAQGVLQRASAELTIKDASAIADNTLECSVRSVLWALGAPELLRASQGACVGVFVCVCRVQIACCEYDDCSKLEAAVFTARASINDTTENNATPAGSMAWHGRDLRQYKRLLSPPLERLLTCPGTAALGRGLASIPISSLREAGLPSTLSTLAEDAVTVGGRLIAG